MVPQELKKRPITLNEARAAGLTRKVLRGKAWRRVGSSLYRWAALSEDALQLLHAWHRRLPDAVFTGVTSAWLYRLDVDPTHPVEVAVPPDSGVRSRPGLIVHRATLETVQVRGLPTATLTRTFADLRRRLSRLEVLALADEALRKRLGRFDELAEPAESPMETRLRWTLLEAGLPPPQVQVKLSFGRADLYYPSARLVVEYDGGNHRERLIEDDRRQNLLINAGYRVLRFTAGDRPEAITAQVRQALVSGTAPPAAARSA